MFSSDLQLFDGLSSFADDEADFVGGDEDLLDGAVAVHVAVEAWAITALLHNLTQQPLGLPAGVDEAKETHLLPHKNVCQTPRRCAGDSVTH